MSALYLIEEGVLMLILVYKQTISVAKLLMDNPDSPSPDVPP